MCTVGSTTPPWAMRLKRDTARATPSLQSAGGGGLTSAERRPFSARHEPGLARRSNSSNRPRASSGPSVPDPSRALMASLAAKKDPSDGREDVRLNKEAPPPPPAAPAAAAVEKEERRQDMATRLAARLPPRKKKWMEGEERPDRLDAVFLV